jgi:hypothetical protein
MSGSKHFDTIAWIVSILIVAIAILFMDHGGALGIEKMTRAMGYEKPFV